MFWDELQAQELAEDMYGGGDDSDEDDSDYDLGYDDAIENGEDPVLVSETEFSGVEMILPRRMFRGAKNVRTVKDCMFSLPTRIELAEDVYFGWSR
jgi:hypothetical protein